MRARGKEQRAKGGEQGAEDVRLGYQNMGRKIWMEILSYLICDIIFLLELFATHIQFLTGFKLSIHYFACSVSMKLKSVVANNGF